MELSDNQIIYLGLLLVRDNLEKSGYDSNMKHQMMCRVNRMIAGVVSDSNPEGKVLDGYIYELGLNLILKSNEDDRIKSRAERLLGE